MTKFYIQSGNVSFIVVAQDAEGAALWAMNQTINKFVTVEQTDQRVMTDETMFCIFEGLAEFGPQVRVSQMGIGRDDAGVFETDELFNTWRTLMWSMNNLFDQLG